MQSILRMILISLCAACFLFVVAECASRQKRGGGYGGGYGGYNLYGPYYDKFDFYYGIPGFHVYSKYGSGDYGYGKAVFAGEHGYGGGYGGGGY
ncbi:neuropeptide-like protein 31 [Paramacrobiotus metropolitanus]|uniref:neuropeptide-like protein 31 n=1 Tax=Paramacrobiotus metropolitanus TaxID=2943436 RepID=UPI0024460CD6|nr:neuropeptide-like protein 31 [Paramacrobiotus metropolitanus]